MKLGKLILRKIIKIFATRCLILWLKCTKIDFGCPDPAGGAYSVLPDPLLDLGPYFSSKIIGLLRKQLPSPPVHVRWTSKYMKFGKLILRKLIKIFATRCLILWLKCTKIDFGWGSAPDPAGGAYSAPPDPLARFKGPTSKGMGG